MKKLSYYILPRDVRIAPYLPVFLLLSWVLPQRSWGAASKWFARLPKLISPLPRDAERRDWPGRAAPEVARERRIEKMFEAFRVLGPGGWRRAIDFRGREALNGSVAEGQSVVLWVATTWSADLVTKKAFHEAGLRVHHLSRPEHGGAYSSFGRIVLNGIFRRAEGRYLAERIVVTGGTERAATRRLREILEDGGVVSITASPRGTRVHHFEICGGLMPLATGAPALAHATGALLVPVFCFRLPADATGVPPYEVIACSPISVPEAQNRDDAIKAAILAFGALHREMLEGRYDQWTGYGYLEDPAGGHGA